MPSDRFEINENFDRILTVLHTSKDIGMEIMAEGVDKSAHDTMKNLLDTIKFVKDMKVLVPYILYLHSKTEAEKEELYKEDDYLPKLKVFYDSLDIFHEDKLN